MASQQIGNPVGVITPSNGDADSPSNVSGTADPSVGFVDTDLGSIGAMDTRLAAIDGAYYTTAKLDSMTFNDKVYALRVHDNPATIG